MWKGSVASHLEQEGSLWGWQWPVSDCIHVCCGCDTILCSLQDVTIAGGKGGGWLRRTLDLCYFLQLHVKLQLLQNKKVLFKRVALGRGGGNCAVGINEGINDILSVGC